MVDIRILYSSAIEVCKRFLKSAPPSVSMSVMLEHLQAKSGVGVHIYRQKKNRDIIRALEGLLAAHIRREEIKQRNERRKLKKLSEKSQKKANTSSSEIKKVEQSKRYPPKICVEVEHCQGYSTVWEYLY